MSSDITVSILFRCLSLDWHVLPSYQLLVPRRLGQPHEAIKKSAFVTDILQPLPRHDRASVRSHRLMSIGVRLSDDTALQWYAKTCQYLGGNIMS